MIRINLRAIERLVFIFFLVISSSTYALNSVNVVEIANFYCQECYKANQFNKRIEDAVKERGGVFHFVPVLLNYSTGWPTRVYFSIPKEFEGKAKEAFFTAANVSGLTMKTPESACVVLHDAIPSYSVDACIKRAISTLPNERLARTLTLLKHIYNKPDDILLFPIYVVEKDNEVKATLSRQQYEEVEVLVNEVVRYVNSI